MGRIWRLWSYLELVTIPSLLPAWGNIAALMHGKAVHCLALRRGISNNVYVGSALIDMFAICGKIHLSRLSFDKMHAGKLSEALFHQLYLHTVRMQPERFNRRRMELF
ncbi:hypothetical protein C1H46_045739 [Malus baccata]|uniref:Uncharacterized protein n=1 Tax=Malus baccata TaxID=106549 RepID=A0A540K3A5_MALBA|nr:hypothetical protein C1H46_045739 [Malus baccata]